MEGTACIRGMRVTIGMIAGQIGADHSIEDALTDFPYHEREDVLEALWYAAKLSQVADGPVCTSFTPANYKN